MKELWTGMVEVLTAPAEVGNTKAFTNVVAWASSGEEFAKAVTLVFADYGWTVIDIEENRPISMCNRMNEELAELVERAKNNSNACIYGTFHYYPSKPA
jgi:hypothetical protein